MVPRFFGLMGLLGVLGQKGKQTRNIFPIIIKNSGFGASQDDCIEIRVWPTWPDVNYAVTQLHPRSRGDVMQVRCWHEIDVCL